MGLDAVAPGLGSIGLPIFNAIVPDFFNIGNPDYAAAIAQGIAHQKADPEYAAKVQANIEAAQVSPIEPRGGGGRAVRQ